MTVTVPRHTRVVLRNYGSGLGYGGAVHVGVEVDGRIDDLYAPDAVLEPPAVPAPAAEPT